jgi:hypothetical protein
VFPPTESRFTCDEQIGIAEHRLFNPERRLFNRARRLFGRGRCSIVNNVRPLIKCMLRLPEFFGN